MPSVLRMRSTRLLLALVVAAATAGGTFAYFSSKGLGDASARVGTFTAATLSAPATAGASITVTWTSQATLEDPSLNGGITYTMQRMPRAGSYTPVVSGPCSGSLPYGTSSCTDTVGTSGTYSYRVIATFRSWTAVSNEMSVDAIVPPAATTTTLTSSDNPAAVGEPVTYTATVSTTGAGTMTGTVTFEDGGSTVSCGSASSVEGTSASCTVTYSAVTAGSPHAITAVYEGDSRFLRSTSNVVDQEVVKGDQAVAFRSVPPAHGKVGTTYELAAAATSGLAVGFTIDSGSSSVCSLAGSTVTFTTLGVCTIDAEQAGDGNWNAAARAQQHVTVDTKGGQTISFGALADRTFDQSSISVSAGASSGLAVTFTSATTAVCTSGGSDGRTITFVTTGICTVSAVQTGDANWDAAPQAQQSFTIGKGGQAVAFTSVPPAHGKVGTTYELAARATSGLAVGFTIDSDSTSVCSLAGSTVTFTTLGVCTIDADQAGDGNWNAAARAQQHMTIDSKGDQAVAFVSTPPTDATVGGKTYIAAAAAGSGLTVAFSSETPSVCTAGGTNGATIAFIAAGTCTVDAGQPGNANWNAAPKQTQSFTVTTLFELPGPFGGPLASPQALVVGAGS